MSEKLIPYDPAQSLETPGSVAYFLEDAFDTSDAAYIAHAIGIAARAHGMTRVAGETGLAREALYRSFSEDGNPSLKSTIAVLATFGLTLTVRPASAEEKGREAGEAAE
jgi:probable addiction module antidote protein